MSNEYKIETKALSPDIWQGASTASDQLVNLFADLVLYHANYLINDRHFIWCLERNMWNNWQQWHFKIYKMIMENKAVFYIQNIYPTQTYFLPW